MRRAYAAALALVALLAAACGGPGDGGVGELRIDRVTPERMPQEGASVVVEGEALFEPVAGVGFAGDLTVEVCGVALTDIAVEGETAVLVTAPGTTVTIRKGTRLTATLPPHEATGRSDVTVTRPDGRTVTVPDAVDCYDPTPTVGALTIDPDPALAGLPATFAWSVASPDGEALACRLDPGDGSEPYGYDDCAATTEQVHTYASEDAYEAELTVTDASGREAALTRTIYVGNAPPTAAIAADVTSGTAPLEVAFDATGSSDPNDAIVAYAWTFGDGATATGATPSHVFDRGAYTVTLRVTDASGASDEAELGVTVDNAPPEVLDLRVTLDEDTSRAFSPVVTDYEDDPITYTVTDAPDHGTITGTWPDVTYTPDPDWNGDDTAVLRVEDDQGGADTATITFAVAPVNDRPVASSSSYTMNEDGSLGATLVATDVDGDPLTYTIVEEPLIGTASGTYPAFTYVPDPDVFGSDSFAFRVTDPDGASDLATVDITIDPVNDAPRFITRPANRTILRTGSYDETFLVEDVEGDEFVIEAPFTIAGPTLPWWLTLVDDGDGTARLSGSPGNGNTRTHSFDVRARELGTGALSSTITVVIDVEPLDATEPIIERFQTSQPSSRGTYTDWNANSTGISFTFQAVNAAGGSDGVTCTFRSGRGDDPLDLTGTGCQSGTVWPYPDAGSYTATFEVTADGETVTAEFPMTIY